MAKLEELIPGVCVLGLEPQGLVTIVAAKWYGDSVLELSWKNSEGNLSSRLLYREDESTISLQEKGWGWPS